MLINGFVKGRQWQGLMFAGKLADGSRVCNWSRRRALLFMLLLGSVLFVCSTNIKEHVPNYKPNWLLQYDATQWWISSSRQNIVSPNVTGSYVTPAETSSPAPPHSEVMTSATMAVTNDTRQTNASVEPPYTSPGPYLVEYPYQYNYIINQPKRCEQQKPFLVLMVPVAPHNRAHRDIVRRTWGGESLVLDKVVSLFFVLGRHAGHGAQQLQEQLLQESEEHQDLIQSDFLDCYKNLTIKTMVMLEWLDAQCSGASYAMKIDSDMFLNLPNLINMLANAPTRNYMSGLVEKEAVVHRDPHSKWYVPEELYPNSFYPCYALGLGYLLSLDLPRKLVEASRHVKAIYLEDVYLGMCMEHLGIPLTDPTDVGYFYVFPVTYSRCSYSRLIATTTYQNTDRLWTWRDFKRPGRYCS